jgi:hypothetical protein
VRSPIITKFVSGVIANVSRPLKTVPATGSGMRLGATPRPRRRSPDVIRRRAAATADDVHEAVARELAEHAARVVRLLVVTAELVGRPAFG